MKPEIYVLKENYDLGKERIIAVCTSKENVEELQLKRLKEIYPISETLKLEEIEKIEAERIWYKENNLKIIYIPNINSLISWKK